jgi:hypothetical protein
MNRRRRSRIEDRVIARKAALRLGRPEMSSKNIHPRRYKSSLKELYECNLSGAWRLRLFVT